METEDETDGDGFVQLKSPATPSWYRKSKDMLPEHFHDGAAHDTLEPSFVALTI